MTPPLRLRFEHRDGLGVGTARPRVSWQLPPTVPEQTGYELATSDGRRAGLIGSAEQLLVPWPFAPLRSREAVTVRVRVRGSDGLSGWSEPATVEAGLLDPADWVAVPVGTGDRRPVRVRTDFTVDRPVRSARLHVTAHGVHETEINGARVGRDVLAPEWTVYGTRLTYRTYDVTDLVVRGPNAIGAWLGDGWWRGRLGFDGGTSDLYGTDQSLLAQLEVTDDTGHRTVVATGPGWQVADSPILLSSLYDGETYDARLAGDGWSRPGGGGPGWTPAAVSTRDPATLRAAVAPPIRRTEERSPVSVAHHGDGRRLLDFGQNLVGRLRIEVDGPAGTEVVLRHAEVLQQGEPATWPLRDAAATDRYVLRGGGPETWTPRFTTHGFRHAEVTGWPGELHADQVTAEVLHTDMRRTGRFGCSDPLVTRLHENVVWSLRGNMVGLPTDCPNRDERLGWTGDLQVFAPTAAFLYDCTGLLDSWLTDVAAEQLPDGTVPWYVPVIPGGPMWTPIRPGAAWGDVAALTPWVLYERTGDRGLLERHAATGRAWVDLVERLAGPERLWDDGFQLGDWLDPAAPADDPAAGRTDRYLVATAYFAHSARTVARTAAELGDTSAAARYGRLADEIAVAFRARYERPGGRLSSDAPTAYALAIAFGLATDRAAAGRRLAELVAADGHRIATGFVGTPLICDALTDTGHLDTAYRLLLQTECPSWLYPVTMGATTTWERWDGLRPDGTLSESGMTSFNHYALGAVADWLHRVVAGLAPAAPGYRRITFHPRPGGGLSSAWAEHDSPYGTARIAWQDGADGLHVAVIVPPGSTGQVHLPGRAPVDVGPGHHEFHQFP
jgi:alpha-L-rhamnosidase